jgi:YVTN family beta-propeller protein
MHFPATVAPQRHWLSAAIVGALALNSVFAFAAPFAYVPENTNADNTPTDLFWRVDVATEKASPTAPISVASGNLDADTATKFVGVAVNDATNRLFLADQGHAKSVLQVDINNISPTTTIRVPKVYPTGGDPTGLTVERSGKRVFVATFDGQTVTVIDTTKCAATATNPNCGNTGLTDIEFNITGARGINPADVRLNISDTVGYVSDGSDSQLVCRFNAVTPPFGDGPGDGIQDGDCVGAGFEPDTGADLHALAVSPDGARVYVLGRSDNSVSVIDTTKSPMALVNVIQIGGGSNNGIVVDRSGRIAYVSDNKGHLRTLDLVKLEDPTKTADQVTVRDLTSPTHLGMLEGLALTPDGKSLLVIDKAPERLHIIDVSGPLNNPTPTITDVATKGGSQAFGQFTSPDDRIFVSEIGPMATGG